MLQLTSNNNYAPIPAKSSPVKDLNIPFKAAADCAISERSIGQESKSLPKRPWCLLHKA